MPATDEKIISELSKYNTPVRYSQLRKKFKEPDFLDRLSFLISTGYVVIVGSGEKESKYPEEAVIISKVQTQYEPEFAKSVDVNPKDFGQYTRDFLAGKELESSAAHIINDEEMRKEPFLFYKPNMPKFIEWIRNQKGKS